MNTGRVVVVTAVADTILRATGLISFPLLARQVGADGYGAYTQVNSIAAFVVPFASLGLSGAMVRFFAARSWGPAVRRDLGRVMLVVLASSTLLALIMFLSSGWLNRLALDWPNGETLFRAAAVLVVVGALEQTVINTLRARDRLYLYSSYTVAQGCVLLVALVATLRGPEDLVRTVVALAIGRGGLALVASLVVGVGDGHVTSTDGPPARMLDMIRYGLPMAVSAVGLWIVNLGDRVLIGHYRDADELGRYGSVYTFATLVAIATGPVLLPALGRMMRATQANDHERAAADVSTFHRYVAMGSIGAALGLGVLIQPVVRLVGGQDFEVSRLLVAMIVAGLFLDQWNGIAHYVLLCNDRTRLLQVAWMSAGAFNVAANVVAVQVWGLQGAALMTLLTFAFLEVTVYRAASQYVPLRNAYCWATSWKALVAGVVAGTVAQPIVNASDHLLPVVLAGLGFGLTYIAMLIVLRELTGGDLAKVRGLWVDGRSSVSV